ncbi:hypothetical protein, partial [Bacillus subtilis]|uniref:hypothetical protein n=1 Tax=Bacillus subtilis TaxID=1423 RepID=UPI003F7BCE61
MGFANEYTDGGFTAVIGEGTGTGIGTTTGPLPYQAISMEWMDSIKWTLNGANKIGLNAELKNQLMGRGVGIPHAMIYVLVMTKDQRNDQKSAREFATALSPRDLKVIKVHKTITTKTESNGKTTSNSREEEMLFVTSIRTYKGMYTYKLGYQTDEHSSTSDGTTTTVITKTPVLASTDLEEDDQIIDSALKT